MLRLWRSEGGVCVRVRVEGGDWSDKHASFYTACSSRTSLMWSTRLSLGHARTHTHTDTYEILLWSDGDTEGTTNYQETTALKLISALIPVLNQFCAAFFRIRSRWLIRKLGSEATLEKMCLFPPPNLPPSFEDGCKKKKRRQKKNSLMESPPPTTRPPPPPPLLPPGDEWRHLTSADTGFKCTIRPRRHLNKLISECYLVRAELPPFSPRPQKVQRAAAPRRGYWSLFFVARTCVWEGRGGVAKWGGAPSTAVVI